MTTLTPEVLAELKRLVEILSNWHNTQFAAALHDHDPALIAEAERYKVLEKIIAEYCDPSNVPKEHTDQVPGLMSLNLERRKR